jgi:hypothetical protein
MEIGNEKLEKEAREAVDLRESSGESCTRIARR